MTEEAEIGSLFVSNYPPYSFWEHGHLREVEAALNRPPRPDTTLGLYLHIPFCRKRCRFCYFRVYTDKDARQIEGYVEALVREVELYGEREALRGRPLDYVYFGGGTPSFIAVKHLQQLVDGVQAVFPWDAAREITFECEPGTLTQSKLEAIREIGVTRLSLGIENFDDGILELNGRAHLTKEIDRVKPWIDALDFDQLNVDLIAGMLGETWETWRETVRKTVQYGPDSVTIYQLELPYNTLITRDLQEGELETPVADWELKRAWQDYAFAQLEAAGYELSSAYTMVRKDRDVRFVYRDSVWHGQDLLGTGVASFSHLSGVHFQNVDGWGEYLDRLEHGILPLNRAFSTSEPERLTRELILQLKLGRIEASGFERKFGVDIHRQWDAVWRRLEAEEMAHVDADGIELTRKGLLQVDSLLPNFYAPKYQNARYT